MQLSDLKIFKPVVDEGGIFRAALAPRRVQSNQDRIGLSTGSNGPVPSGRGVHA